MQQRGIFAGRTEVRCPYARWGWTRGGGKVWHGGLDLAGLDDATIRMPYYKGKRITGRVTRARIVTDRRDKTWEWGYYVCVQLDRGQTPDAVNFLYFAHCASLLVKAGQRVASGDALAVMGNTGNAALADPPYRHCHLEVRAAAGGVGLDPTVYAGCENAVGVYGAAGRMILNYDLTFLAMLLSEGGGTCEKRCAVHPVRKRRCACGDAAMDVAADMSVILTWWQIQDGIADHGFFKGLKYRAAALLLRRAYRKAQRRQPDFDKETQRHLTALAALEKEKCPSLDRPADTFAALLAGAAQHIADPVKRRVTEQLLYHLGRWVYLVDAADDLSDDLRTGSYNPLALRFPLENGALTAEGRQQFAATLDGSVRAMAAAFELADFGVYTPVIRAAVYEGLYLVGAAVLNGTFHRRRRERQAIRKADTNDA